MLTLLTVGTHQPYSAPADYDRCPSAKQAAVAYLDDAIDAFLADLEKQGVLRDTLVVLTSDESHGVDQVRLASAWGFNLVLAPEQAALPPIKSGVYGHVDLAASVLDYFGYRVPAGISGRSLFRDYASGREMMSYTNGMLRHHDGKDTSNAISSRSAGATAARASSPTKPSSSVASAVARHAWSASAPPSSTTPCNRPASWPGVPVRHPRTHPPEAGNPQRLDRQPDRRAIPGDAEEQQDHGHPRSRALQMDRNGARMTLKTKEFERDVPIPVPDIPRLLKGKPLDMSFTFDNPEARKAFSFHAAEGGIIEISDFHAVTAANPEPVESRSQVAEAAKEQPLLSTLKSLFANRPKPRKRNARTPLGSAPSSPSRRPDPFALTAPERPAAALPLNPAPSRASKIPAAGETENGMKHLAFLALGGLLLAPLAEAASFVERLSERTKRPSARTGR